jgi:GTP-binding protein
VSTSSLNQALARWLKSSPPKINVKVRYATQVSTNPVVFVFFTNKSEGFPANYHRYLKNKIRSDLGFDSIPIKLDIRRA